MKKTQSIKTCIQQRFVKIAKFGNYQKTPLRGGKKKRKFINGSVKFTQLLQATKRCVQAYERQYAEGKLI